MTDNALIELPSKSSLHWLPLHVCRFVLQSRLLLAPEEQPDELPVLTVDVASRLLVVAYASCHLIVLR